MPVRRDREVENEPTGGTIVSAGYSAPLPPPVHFEEYDRILPGAADRIVTEFERNSGHRREVEIRLVDAEIRDHVVSRRIEVFSYFCAISVIFFLVVSGIYIATMTNAGTWNKVFGSGLSIAGLGGIAKTFLKGRGERKG